MCSRDGRKAAPLRRATRRPDRCGSRRAARRSGTAGSCRRRALHGLRAGSRSRSATALPMPSVTNSTVEPGRGQPSGTWWVTTNAGTSHGCWPSQPPATSNVRRPVSMAPTSAIKPRTWSALGAETRNVMSDAGTGMETSTSPEKYQSKTSATPSFASATYPSRDIDMMATTLVMAQLLSLLRPTTEQASEEPLALMRLGGFVLVLVCGFLQLLFLDVSSRVIVRRSRVSDRHDAHHHPLDDRRHYSVERKTRNEAPPPARSCTHARPPWSSANFATSARPIPTPGACSEWGSSCWNGSKMCS